MSYYSSFFGRYHRWFQELGYPQLDIAEYEDGSWDIIEVVGNPLVPSMTNFNVILGNMRHVEPSFGFVKKYVEMLDTKKRHYWDMEEAKSQAAEDNAAARDKHAEELAEKCSYAVTNNPGLMDRIAQNGLGEINLSQIAKHIPASREPTL